MADKNKMEVNIVPKVDKQALKKAGKELEQFVYTLEEATWTNSKTGKSGKMPVVKSDRFTGLLNARGNGYVLPGEGLTARDLINMYNNNGAGRKGTQDARTVIGEFLRQLKKDVPKEYVDTQQGKKYAGRFAQALEDMDVYSYYTNYILDSQDELRSWMANSLAKKTGQNPELDKVINSVGNAYKSMRKQFFQRVNKDLLLALRNLEENIFYEAGDMNSRSSEEIALNKAKQSQRDSKYAVYNNADFDDEYNLELARKYEREAKREENTYKTLSQIAEQIRKRGQVLPEDSPNYKVESINSDLKNLLRFLKEGEILGSVPGLEESIKDNPDLTDAYNSLRDLSSYISSVPDLDKYLSFDEKDQETIQLLSKDLIPFLEKLNTYLIEYYEKNKDNMNHKVASQLRMRIKSLAKVLGSIDSARTMANDPNLGFSDDTIKTFWDQLQPHIPKQGKQVHDADARRSILGKQGIKTSGAFPVWDIPQYLQGALPYISRDRDEDEVVDNQLLEDLYNWAQKINDLTAVYDTQYEITGKENTQAQAEIELALKNLNTIYKGLAREDKDSAKKSLREYGLDVTAEGNWKKSADFSQEDYQNIVNLIASKKDALTGKNLVNGILELRRLRNRYVEEYVGMEEDENQREAQAIQNLLNDFKQEDFTTSELQNIMDDETGFDYEDIDISQLEKTFNVSGEEMVTRESLQKRLKELMSRVPESYDELSKQTSNLLADLEYDYIEEKLKPFIEKYANATTAQEKRNITNEVKAKYKGTKDESAYVEQWRLYKSQMVEKFKEKQEKEAERLQEELQVAAEYEKAQAQTLEDLVKKSGGVEDGETLLPVGVSVDEIKRAPSSLYIDELKRTLGTTSGNRTYSGPGVMYEGQAKYLSDIKKEFQIGTDEAKDKIIEQLQLIYNSFNEQQKEWFLAELSRMSEWTFSAKELGLDQILGKDPNERLKVPLTSLSQEFLSRGIASQSEIEGSKNLVWNNKTHRFDRVAAEAKQAQQATEQLEAAVQSEEQAIEQVNDDLQQHEKLVGNAAEAEQAKIVVSEKLEKQLAQEADAYQEVNTEAQQDEVTQNRYGHVTDITGFIPNFNENLHQYTTDKGESFYSATQLRDALLKGQNPSFSVDLDRIKAKANENFKKGAGAVTVDDFEGMSEKDFKFMVENVIAQGIRGDVFHSLIDKMVKNDAHSLEELAKNAKLDDRGESDYTKWLKEYQNAVQELQKYGIEEAYLGIQDRLESYMEAQRKSGLTPTKFSEQRLAFRMEGERGAINIGVTPDQLYSMGDGTGAFMDTKTGKVSGMESFQLTAQLLGTMANLDSNLKDAEGNTVKLRDLIGNVDVNKPMKAYIADVQDGMTQLTEYLYLSADEFYNLAMDAQEIKQGRRQPLTKEEQYSRMNRQLKTGRYVGVSSDYMNAEIIEPNQRAQMSEIRNFIQMYRQRLKLEREIAEKEEQIKTANTDQAQQLHEQLASRKRQLRLINEQMPKESHITQTMGDVSMDRTMIGDTMLDYEMAEVLKDLKAREEGRSNINLSDKMAKVFKQGQTASNKEQVSLVREYVDAYKDLYDLELKFSKAEGALELAKMAGVDEEDLQRLQDTVDLYRGWRDTQKGRVEEFGLDEKNAKFIFDEGQIKLSKKNAQKLYSDLEDIRRKYTENQTKAMEAYSKNVRSQETKLNDQLIKAAKQYYNARRELQQMDLDQTKNPALAEGYAPAKAHWEEKSEKALENMRDIVRLAKQFDVNLSSGFDNIKDQTAEYRTYTTNMGAKKSAAQGTGVGAQKLIQEYIANLKQQYHIEQQIHALELKMQDQSGAELKNSQAYMTSLQAQLNTVKQMAPVLNTQERKLNGIELTEEQITNILKQQSALYQTHQVQLDKINARQRESRGLLTEIVTGFRQAFKNLTDASIAYEIIGQIKMGITTLIQTTKELDASMSDLRIASGATKDEMHDMMLEFTDLGAELGRTTQDVSQAANDWLRAGYAGEEAAELTKASAQLSTLGMIDTADATSYLISVLKGWKIEAQEVTKVVDKLTAVDLAAAISAGRDSLNTGRPVDRIKIAS